MGIMRRLNYYTKIQLSLWIFILLPLAAVSVLSYGTIEKLVVDKVNNSRQNVVGIMADNLGRNIEDILYAMNLIGYGGSSLTADLRSFKDVAKIATSAQYRSHQNISEFMDIAFSKTSGLNAPVFLVNNRGYVIYGVNNPLEYQSLKRWLAKPGAAVDRSDNPNAVRWIRSEPLKISYGPFKETYYFAVRSIADPVSGQALGTLYVGIPMQYLASLFAAQDGGQFELYDKEGQLLYSTAGEEAQTRAGEKQDIQYEKTVSKVDWRLVHKTSSGDITREFAQLFRFFALLLGACIVLFLAISVFIARSLHRPLHRLKRTAEQFGGGNRLVRFPTRGSDEVAVLGAAFNKMLDQINRLIANVEQEQEEKRMIELQALFSQIRPHFLLNTLNSIKCNLLMSDDQDNGRQIDALMHLLRAYMRVHEPGPLEEECRLLQDYVDIMNMRNGMQVRLVVELPDELKTVSVPKLILQPLVENAIIHGFEESGDGDRIRVDVRNRGTGFEIEVADNGRGMLAGELAEVAASLETAEAAADSQSIGLGNIRRRLKLTYGLKAEMELRSGEDGTSVVLTIPFGTMR
ncbi:sensor histidine kinase [Cohnella sp.]|uniref:cache domain-containing sensor histidine kinase n=1 Tax=Cohnella sp. TaxID=1883426 RepID=UPI00370453D2